MSLTTRIQSALAALAGKPTAPPPETGTPEATIAALRLDLDERDRRIAALLKEADSARAGAPAEAESAAAERMNKFLRKLAPLLAQADAMRQFAAEGKALRAEDAFALMAKIEKTMADEGVERIGAAGEETVFDSQLHQRMSGGDVSEGSPVKVRFAGFRQGGRILSKAMVSRKEDGDATGG
jgi:molecular chaperone GrpE (heat shock protein)